MQEIVPSQVAIAMGVVGILILGYTPLIDAVYDFYAVEIGLSPGLSHDQCHGFVWFEACHDHKGRLVGAHRVPFVVDREDRLVKPNRNTIMSIWRQLHRAGLNAKSIEIRAGGQIRIYRRNATKPIMVY